MKRVVFLLLVLGCWKGTTIGAASTHVFTFVDYEIRVQETYDAGTYSYILEKIGKDPFSRTLGYPSSRIHINSIIEVNGNHVIYGYIHRDGQASYYDGFLTVLSPAGEELNMILFDEDREEDVRAVYQMEGMLFVALRISEMNDLERYDFLRFDVIALDHQYEIIGTKEIYQEVESMLATDRMLLLNFDHDESYDIGVTTTLETISTSTPLPIATDTVYVDHVYIPFLNEALINQSVAENGAYLDYPGQYNLRYDGFTYTFTIVPEVTGVEDGGVYNDAVTPIISAGQVYLNQDLFVSGSVISEPGDYELNIKGVNGFTQTFQFTITSNLEGVIHNGQYTNPVEVSFLGNGYLNNGFITSPYFVEDPGEYILTIHGKNEYRETYYFTIEEPPANYTLLDFLKQYDLILLGITLVSGFLILKKK